MQHKKKYVSWGLSENGLGRSRVVRPPNKCIPMELNMYMMELNMYMMAKRRSNISVLHANYVPRQQLFVAFCIHGAYCNYHVEAVRGSYSANIFKNEDSSFLISTET